MPYNDESNVKNLEAQINVLDQENRLLSEHSEEILLISLVSEVITKIDEKSTLLENILERISILKNIPFCSCYLIENDIVSSDCYYASFINDETAENNINFSPAIINKINSKPVSIKKNSVDFKEISFTNEYFRPKVYLIFPYKTMSIPSGFFLFADDDSNIDRLESMKHLFQQIINMVIEKLDKIYLSQQLKKLNTELEDRIENRTRELLESNQKLKLEIQERNFTERALKESEAKYKDLFENANDAILLLDVNHNYIDVNKKAGELLGYSKSELLKMNIFDVIPKEQKEKSENELQKLKNTGEYEKFNGKAVTKDGNIINIEVNSSAIIENGQVIGSRDIVRDITERSRIEEFVLNIAKGVSASTGDIFFNSLVNHLCSALNVDYSYIGEIMDDNPEIIKTISVSAGGKIIKNFTYNLANTPCASVLAQETRVYTNNIIEIFPEDQLLVDLQIEGYIGTVLSDSKNNILGILVVLTKKQILEPNFIKSILQIFAVRVSAELERTKSENTLRQSEAKFKQLFEEIPDAIFITEIGGPHPGQILDVNSAALKQTGYNKNELIGMNIIHDLAQIHNMSENKERESELIAGNTVKFNEKKRRKDGSEYWVEVLITPIIHDQKKVAVSVNRDISTQKLADEKIRKLSRSVEQSNASIVITDLKGDIEYVNPKFVSVTGYTFEEVKGKNPRILKGSNKTKEEYKKLWDTITSGKEWRGEFQNMKKNGELYWEFASISPIKNEHNEVTHFVAVKEDITKKKQLQQQLNQAQKMESIGTLAGGIAHDFNNLLTIINGHSELALMKINKKDDLYQDLNAIMQAGKRAENLTSHLLAFSRKQVFKPIILDVYNLINNFDKIMHRLIGVDIEIKTNLVSKNPKIKADPGQIEQIIMNLIINARDALNARKDVSWKKIITIEIGHIDYSENSPLDPIGTKPGRYVYFAINDNGIGMDEDTKNKIFEPFFTTKEKGKGTGLGLSTVYGIVKQNKGNIYLYSEREKGTTFKIFWPATEENETKKSRTVESSSLIGNENILLVEDDNEVRKFAVTTLKNLGYNVLEASKGKDALDLIQQKNIKIDLLITDLIMPEMSGKDLSHIFKRKYPETKILFTSGYIENQFTEKEITSKSFNFISKPYSIQLFAQKIKEVLKQPAESK